MRKSGTALAAGALGLATLGWFYRPATSLEWAAWVQAGGVLAAIGCALRLQAASSRQHLRQAAQVAAIFATNMHWVFRELNDACGKRSWPDYTVHRRILDEILAQGREVTLQLLDGRSLAMVSSLRTIAVEALEISEPHTESGNWSHLQIYFDKRLPSIAAWLSATGHPPESSGPTDYVGLRTSFGQLGGR
ncbi:MAG: hypothetical protein WKG52_13695 [Variovorax sp.]